MQSLIDWCLAKGDIHVCMHVFAHTCRRVCTHLSKLICIRACFWAVIRSRRQHTALRNAPCFLGPPRPHRILATSDGNMNWWSMPCNGVICFNVVPYLNNIIFLKGDVLITPLQKMGRKITPRGEITPQGGHNYSVRMTLQQCVRRRPYASRISSQPFLVADCSRDLRSQGTTVACNRTSCKLPRWLRTLSLMRVWA